MSAGGAVMSGGGVMRVVTMTMAGRQRRRVAASSSGWRQVRCRPGVRTMSVDDVDDAHASMQCRRCCSNVDAVDDVSNAADAGMQCAGAMRRRTNAASLVAGVVDASAMLVNAMQRRWRRMPSTDASGDGARVGQCRCWSGD